VAGVFVNLEWIDGELRATLNRIERFGAQPFADPGVQRDIGEHLLNSTKARAAAGVDPDGQTWLELSPAYARRKQRLKPGRPILTFEGEMLDTRLAYDLDGDDFVFGTASVYGATHQWGRGAIPARPWLGLTDDDGEAIEGILMDRLSVAIQGDSGSA